jgi:hypothetical protein
MPAEGKLAVGRPQPNEAVRIVASLALSMALALRSLTRLLAVLRHAAELMQMACRMEHHPGSPNAHDRMLGLGSVP